jgi:choice-of-anchor B domain-containing protein
MDFPNQTLANVCGYWQNGQEYALLGGSQGMIIVDITNPAQPQQIVQIPGPNNLWKEIKVYSHYAYVTSEGGQGLQIVNLSNLPASNLQYKYYTGDGAIQGDLDRIHALHIDVTKGYLYAYGANYLQGGAIVFDLNIDPYNPRYVGTFEQLGYIHDGYVDNDTLYACHIESGIMSVVDMADKSNPVVLGTVETPGKFTHNSWITDDRKHVLTTDEAAPSFLTAYDVSNPEDIRELDRISPNDGVGTYVHNTHILNDYAVTSWYTSGVLIVDAHRPENLVTVAQYDTYAGNLLEFEGCWGVFPYFPSGTVIATDIDPGQLTVLTPSYQRACYFEGKIINACNGQPMIGATVQINSNDPVNISTTRADGIFRTGQVTPGNFTATVNAPGFPPQNVNITLAPGQVTYLEISIDAGPTTTINGAVTVEGTNNPVANAQVVLTSSSTSFTVTTNANGTFNLECIPAGNYTAAASKWGFLPGTATVSNDGQVLLQLTPGYYDDFEFDLGWTTSSTADAGDWELGNPTGTYNNGNAVSPEDDIALDNNENCYTTALGGGQPGSNDVDNGTVTLITPSMQLAAYEDAILTFHYWFYNDYINSNPPNDRMNVRLLNGNQTFNLLTVTESESQWRFSGEIHLGDFASTLSNNTRIQFSTTDESPGHWLETAIDIFQITPVTSSGAHTALDQSALVMVAPNPSSGAFQLHYEWQNAAENPVLEVRNLLGQAVQTISLTSKTGIVHLGDSWTPGVYFTQLHSAGRRSEMLKMIKQ